MKILAVCGFGVGSSLVLRMTMKSRQRTWGLMQKSEVYRPVSTAKATPADVYFTSFGLQRNSEKILKIYLSIKKYMDANEVKEQLNRYLSSIRRITMDIVA